MANKNLLQPYTEQRVILAAVSDELQQDENFEPPFVRLRSPNSAFVYLDTSYTSSVNQSNVIIGFKGGDLFTRRIKRFAVRHVDISWVTPNVNVRNNSITFAVDSLSTVYTATIPEQFYTTPASIFTALATAMTAVSGDTFTTIQLYPGANAYQLSSTGHTFAFLSGPMVTTGQFMFGIYPANIGTLVSSFTLINTSMSYTRFININSLELTQYSKLPSSGVDTTSQNIVKVFLVDGLATAPSTISFPVSNPLQWNNFARDRNISTVDLQIVDEWGQFLYVPSFYDPGFYLLLSLYCEL